MKSKYEVQKYKNIIKHILDKSIFKLKILNIFFILINPFLYKLISRIKTLIVAANELPIATVSYTHLTLPPSDLV